MPRRFTVTEKWTQDKWFMELSAPAKLIFIFLYENCDCAGFWEINIKEAAYRIALNEETVYQAFKDIEKCYVRDERFCVIVSFLYHQRNLPLNPENKAHIGILNRLISHPGLYETLKIRWESKGYIQTERPLWNQAPSKPLPRGYGKGKGKGNGNGNGNKGGLGGKSGNPKDKFSKPTPEEVEAYGKSIGFAIDGHEFVDFYESKDWMIGKNRMKDWKAAVRTWKTRKEKDGADKTNRNNQPIIR